VVGAALVSEPAGGLSVAPVVHVTGFSKEYRRKPALRGVNLAVRAGEIYGLIGPDGAGKSSLMKALAGVLSFEGGTVEVFGISLDSERSCERIKDRIGFMPQGLGLNLYPELSVEENVDFFAALRLVPRAELPARKQRLLAMTRLDRFRTRPMKQLSGGMKQKLGLICTLIHEPRLLILDEPTTGVDPVSRRDFWTILAQLVREQGITAVISTAYMDEASRFDRLSLLHEGEVLAEGAPEELLALAPGAVVSLRAEPQLDALERLRTRWVEASAEGNGLRVFTGDTDRDAAGLLVRSCLEGFEVSDVQVREPDLEDLFISLLRKRRTAPAPAPPLAAVRRIPEQNRPDIEAEELTRDFDRFRAVDRVSFRISDGEIFGLLGANGAGKTTVIKMLTGILPPSSGRGRVAGVDMRRPGSAIKRRIGYMSQAFSLYQDLTVEENIRLYAGIYGLSRAETRTRLDWILATSELHGSERTLAGSLPMGLRQRLALGCALVHRPEVLFLDEPTSGVDPVGRRQFWETLFRLARTEGVAILVTTHHLSEAEQCDRVALMYAGRIVANASPAELKRQMETEAGRMLEIAADRPAAAVECLARSGYEAALFGQRLHLLSRQPDEDAPRIAQLLAAGGVRAESVTPRPLSLEDVFIHLVTGLERREQGGEP